MKKGFFPAILALCLLLSGCSSLLERSYSVVEPYTDRYWDPSAEDTLRAESYQDLVNSLLMLVEQRIEEGVIRCYEEASSYQQALAAQAEVRNETSLGSYLLEKLSFTFESGPSYSTVIYQMTYRDDAEDIDSIMTLSDTQSLVDLLRLAVREEHKTQTAQFVYDTPRADVIAAVESLWQELCAGEAEEIPPAPEDASEEEQLKADEDAPAEVEPEAEPTLDAPEEAPPAEPAPQAEGGVEPVPAGPEEEQDVEPEVSYPPCPWEVRFYPDKDMASIVEILLTTPQSIST